MRNKIRPISFFVPWLLGLSSLLLFFFFKTGSYWAVHAYLFSPLPWLSYMKGGIIQMSHHACLSDSVLKVTCGHITYLHWVGYCMLQWTYEGQKTTSSNWFFPSTVWVPGSNSQSHPWQQVPLLTGPSSCPSNLHLYWFHLNVMIAYCVVALSLTRIYRAEWEENFFRQLLL